VCDNSPGLQIEERRKMAEASAALWTLRTPKKKLGWTDRKIKSG
jgi:hypothetical protein